MSKKFVAIIALVIMIVSIFTVASATEPKDLYIVSYIVGTEEDPLAIKYINYDGSTFFVDSICGFVNYEDAETSICLWFEDMEYEYFYTEDSMYYFFSDGSTYCVNAKHMYIQFTYVPDSVFYIINDK